MVGVKLSNLIPDGTSYTLLLCSVQIYLFLASHQNKHRIRSLRYKLWMKPSEKMIILACDRFCLRVSEGH